MDMFNVVSLELTIQHWRNNY